MAKIKYLGHDSIGDVYRGNITISKGEIADVDDGEAQRLIDTFGNDTFKLMKPILKETPRPTTKAAPRTKETARNKTKRMVKK